MANDLAANPIILDTDVTSFRALWQTQTGANAPNSFRIRSMVLAVGAGGASSAGRITISNQASSRLLYPPIPVAAAVAAYQLLITDGPWSWDDRLDWPDFAVTGLTATGTRLFVWLRNS